MLQHVCALITALVRVLHTPRASVGLCVFLSGSQNQHDHKG